MIRYEAPDGWDEPTIWEAVDEDDQYPQPILSRHDLHPKFRHLWPLIVEVMATK